MISTSPLPPSGCWTKIRGCFETNRCGLTALKTALFAAGIVFGNYIDSPPLQGAVLGISGFGLIQTSLSALDAPSRTWRQMLTGATLSGGMTAYILSKEQFSLIPLTWLGGVAAAYGDLLFGCCFQSGRELEPTYAALESSSRAG